jgi:hypothetical protein
MARTVLPKVALDLVSYSSYDTMAGGQLADALDYLAAQHVPTSGTPLTDSAVYVAEFGVAQMRSPPATVEAVTENVVKVALSAGPGGKRRAAHVFWWELFCNEDNCRDGQPGRCNWQQQTNPNCLSGWWLMTPAGEKTWPFFYFQGLINGSIPVPTVSSGSSRSAAQGALTAKLEERAWAASSPPAAVAAAAAAPGETCTFQQDQDYAQGEGGPSSPATSAADCCAQCVAAGPEKCFAAVFDIATGGVCWFKTQAQTAKPVWSPNLVACWPSRPSPAPSPAPPPPPPPLPLYSVTVTILPPEPVLSFLAGQTAWPQSFNPSFVEASAGTRGVRGLLVRSQNCSFTPGKCLACNPRSPNDNPFLGSVITFAAQNADGTFQKPYLVFAPEGSHDEKGTEDPRIKYDKRTGLYHMFCALLV